MALLAVVPVIFDGWLLYIERVSYIENALMIFVVLGFLLYARALDPHRGGGSPSPAVALGAAASFKQTGAYVFSRYCSAGWIVRRRRRGTALLAGAPRGDRGLCRADGDP